jgi:hypothetical protein
MLKKDTTLCPDNLATATLTLSPDAPLVDHNGYEHPDLQVLSSEGGNVNIRGITIDCNQKAFPENVAITAGLRVTGDNNIYNCSIIGLRGSYERKLEAFGFSCYGTGIISIASVIVSDCADNAYVSAFNFGLLYGSLTADSLTADLGTGNWLAFGLNCNVRLQNSAARGARFALYNDTNVTDNCVVRGLDATGVEYVLSLRHPANDKGQQRAHKGNIAVLDSKFKVAHDAQGNARMCELWDEFADIAFRGHEFQPIVFSNCVFECPPKDGTQIYLSSAVVHPQAKEPDITFAACKLPAAGYLMHGTPAKVIAPIS